MPRFEYKDDRSHKFWEIEQAGDSYTVSWGKMLWGYRDSGEQSQTKVFATQAEARTAASKQIISLEAAGMTQTDGWEDHAQVVATVWEPAGRASAVRGACFYAEDEVELAFDGGGLRLTFGAESATDEDAVAVAVGHEIVEVLEQHGLETVWEETADDRILVLLTWQRRSAPRASTDVPARLLDP